MKCVEHRDMLRRNDDVHHDIVARRFEVEPEERTALAFPPGQVARGCLDEAPQYDVEPLRSPALRAHDEGEQVVELRHPQRTVLRRQRARVRRPILRDRHGKTITLSGTTASESTARSSASRRSKRGWPR